MFQYRDRKLIDSIVTVILLLSVNVAKAETNNPHMVSKTQLLIPCDNCHIATPELKDESLLSTKNHSMDRAMFKLDGVEMCSPCHNVNQGHKVGLIIDFPIPADMPLSENNGISCLTCHYTHGNLISTQPQASFSFIDRLLNPERLRKSYLLRRNNTDGELCLTCHNVN